MPKIQMLINYVEGELCRIAITKNKRLEEIYQECNNQCSIVGSIYKGKVLNVESSIQAAFIDFGQNRNGFLHITDLHPMYFPKDIRETHERVGKKTPHKDRPPIQKCLRRGQEILVQVIKEGINTKGPTLTSYLSIPGRFLVMMPYMEKLGVSRKIEDDDVRHQARKMLDEIEPPKDFGFIVRTAGIDRTKTDLKRDLAYLLRLWKSIERRRKLVNVGELYTESDLIIRTLRDIFHADINQVIVDNPNAAKRAAEFLAIVSPRTSSKVVYYADTMPLFDRMGLESQITQIHQRTVQLPSGGSLVIDPTEALVAIDVNSGKMRTHKDAETTAYKTNEEAVDEIARQLRLRDLGGMIVNDLIDMRETKHRRAIEQRLRNLLKDDRAKTRVLAINAFGLMAMTRQRMKPSLNSALQSSCDACNGQGYTKSFENVVLEVMRQLAVAMHFNGIVRIEIAISPDVAFLLLNEKRTLLVDLEKKHNIPVMVRVHNHRQIDDIVISAFDQRGGAVNVEGQPKLPDPQLLPINQLPSELEGTLDRTETNKATPTTRQQNSKDHSNQQSPKIESQAESKIDADGNVIADNQQAPTEKRKPRRRGGRGRKRKNTTQSSEQTAEANASDTTDSHNTNASSPNTSDTNTDTSNTSNSVNASPTPLDASHLASDHSDNTASTSDSDDVISEKKKPQRRSRRRKPTVDLSQQATHSIVIHSTSRNKKMASHHTKQSASASSPPAATVEIAPVLTVSPVAVADSSVSHKGDDIDGNTTATPTEKPKKRRPRRRRSSNKTTKSANTNQTTSSENADAPSVNNTDNTETSPSPSQGYTNTVLDQSTT